MLGVVFQLLLFFLYLKISRYKNILLLRYINGKSYEDISTETSYSTPRIFQLHREAVNVYNEKYFDKNKNSSLEDELTL